MPLTKNLLILVALLASGRAFSEVQSLAQFYSLGSPKYTGGYFSPTVKFTSFLDQKAVVPSAKMGFIFNEFLILGATVHALSTNVDYPAANSEASPRKFGLGYGTGFLGITLFPRAIVNASLFGNYGFGWAKLTRPAGETYKDESEFDYVQVLEPEALLELNLTQNLRIGGGYSYRFVRSLDFPELKDAGLNGSSYLVTLTVTENLAAAPSPRESLGH